VKILVVRFSSIGDIVLTSPVVRAIKEQVKGIEIHYLTKTAFKSIVEPNPRIDKVYTINSSVNEVIPELQKEQYDWVIDLHNNIRTKALKSKLRKPSKTFRKLNFKKWLLVNFKLNKLPALHVVDRYFETVQHLGVKNDAKKGEFYIEEVNRVDVRKEFGFSPKKYIAVAIGAQFATKRLPAEKLIKILGKIGHPVVLIGGGSDKEVAQQVCDELKRDDVFDACGKYNIQQSASIVEQSLKLLTNDTGMMHIASCISVPIISVWGNTVPDLGMSPYMPSEKTGFSIHQVEGLSCRPCSKIGYQKCPKGHFKCMLDQNEDAIIKDVMR